MVEKKEKPIKEPSIDEVEQDAAAADVEPEDLTGIDIGLEDQEVTEVVAMERLGLAVAYQKLKVRETIITASVRANKAVGNQAQEEKFNTELGEVKAQLSHCLRGIREIDREYPKAMGRMQEIAKAQRKNKQ